MKLRPSLPFCVVLCSLNLFSQTLSDRAAADLAGKTIRPDEIRLDGQWRMDAGL